MRSTAGPSDAKDLSVGPADSVVDRESNFEVVVEFSLEVGLAEIAMGRATEIRQRRVCRPACAAVGAKNDPAYVESAQPRGAQECAERFHAIYAPTIR